MEIVVTLIAGSPGSAPSPAKSWGVVPVGSGFRGVLTISPSTDGAVLGTCAAE